jgi:phosphate transport system protein
MKFYDELSSQSRSPPTYRSRLALLDSDSKTTANLERAGDEVEKIARMVKSIIDSGSSRSLPFDLRTQRNFVSSHSKVSTLLPVSDTAVAVSILQRDQTDAS